VLYSVCNADCFACFDGFECFGGDSVFRINKGIFALVFPVILSVAAAFKASILLAVAAILTHFAVLEIVPIFKGRENLWMFIMVTISSIPLNICILKLLEERVGLFEPWVFLGVIRCIAYYLAIVGVEQIVMGIITRVIWKRQYKIGL
jgi:hypothetical protein